MWFKSVWIFCLFLASASLNPKNAGGINKGIQDPGKTLIVYLSRTENTRAVAELIQEATKGELVSLELQNPYPEDYDAIVKKVARENGTGYTWQSVVSVGSR